MSGLDKFKNKAEELQGKGKEGFQNHHQIIFSADWPVA